MMKRFIPAVAVICLLGLPAMAADTPAATPAVAPAATAPANSLPAAIVAVVDIEKILKESTAGKSVRDQLSSKRDTFQQQVTADEQKLNEARQALMQQQSSLTAEQFAAKRAEFEAQARAAQQRVQERARALDAALAESLSTIKNSVGQIVADIAAAKGANVVLDKGQVVVVEAKLDLTAAVLEQLNRKLPRVDVKVADVPAAAGAQARRR